MHFAFTVTVINLCLLLKNLRGYTKHGAKLEGVLKVSCTTCPAAQSHFRNSEHILVACFEHMLVACFNVTCETHVFEWYSILIGRNAPKDLTLSRRLLLTTRHKRATGIMVEHDDGYSTLR